MDYWERQREALSDPRVAAVRRHPKVGRGSCTSVDEALEHTELRDGLDHDGVVTPEGAVRWALEREGLWREQGLNASSGESGCPLVDAFREWQS